MLSPHLVNYQLYCLYHVMFVYIVYIYHMYASMLTPIHVYTPSAMFLIVSPPHLLPPILAQVQKGDEMFIVYYM